jgi:uncharacterized delta-60 repeat protein
MKTSTLILCALGVWAVNNSVLAQPQQAWVARYNGGYTNKIHTPLAMKLDTAGNIYVAGSSQNVSNFYDYVVLKYTPNGTLQWAARYSPTNGGTYPANGFALDQNGNTYLTGGIEQGYEGGVIGNGATVKFNPNGQVAWVAPYTGNDVAVDTNGNAYVTGFSTTQYATAKLNSTGSNLWTRTYVYVTSPGTPVAVSQKVAVDNAGNIYVAGWANTISYYFSGQLHYYSDPIMLMYNPDGNVSRTNSGYFDYTHSWGTTVGLIPDNQGNVYITGNEDSYLMAKINAGGQTMWSFEKGPSVSAMAIDSNTNSYLDGLRMEGGGATSYGTFKLDSNGQELWEEDYYPVSGQHQATAIAPDNLGNVYVTGVSTNTGTGNDFATVKYDTNGNQQWVIRYNGPANGNDGATAIAVAPDGSIYVTGYSQNTSGGSDITTIKYGNLTNIQKKSDGSIQLQFFGNPNQSYNFQATTNFLNWTDLGSSLADTNGLFEFLDTNATLFPHRFYRHSPP